MADVDFQEIVNEVFQHAETYRGHGDIASYIPALARVDPKKLGIAVMLKDGTSYVAGDADEPFSIQSISYVFSLSLGLQHAQAALWNHVGREPSGSRKYALLQLEAEKGRPRNPLTNAGAIVVCDRLIEGRGVDAAADELVAFLQDRGGDEKIDVDERVAISESNAGAMNRSLAHFISAFGNISNPVQDVLSLYYQQCSIAMTCRQLARAGLYLAFDGVCPATGDTVTIPSRSRRVNALMMTSGHYDYSGEFAFRIGVPGKSSISGAILAVVPGTGAVCVWSPGLNAAGTSLAGAVALEKLVDRTNWSVFT